MNIYIYTYVSIYVYGAMYKQYNHISSIAGVFACVDASKKNMHVNDVNGDIHHM